MNYFKELCVFNYLGHTVEMLYQVQSSKESAEILSHAWVSVSEPDPEINLVDVTYLVLWRVLRNSRLPTATIENRIFFTNLISGWFSWGHNFFNTTAKCFFSKDLPYHSLSLPPKILVRIDQETIEFCDPGQVEVSTRVHYIHTWKPEHCQLTWRSGSSSFRSACCMETCGCPGNSWSLCRCNMSRGQSLCCVETLSHRDMYSSGLSCSWKTLCKCSFCCGDSLGCSCGLCSRRICLDGVLGCLWGLCRYSVWDGGFFGCCGWTICCSGFLRSWRGFCSWNIHSGGFLSN